MSHNNDLEILKQFELSWNKAIEENLVSEMGEYMHDDWIIFSGDGNIINKQTFLQQIKSGDLIHSKMDFEILQVKVYENTGLVMHRGTSAGTWQGKDFSLYEIGSTVWVKSNNNKWLAVQTMTAPASKT